MTRGWWGLALGAAGCAPHPGISSPVLPFLFEPRPTAGEVRVLPALALEDPVRADYSSYVGRLSDAEARVRQRRAEQLADLAEAVGVALPGEVNGEVGDRWQAQFREWSYPAGARAKVGEALRSYPDVDRQLGEAARSIGGDAVLISWLDHLVAQPLSALGPPGTLVDTPVGPVALDTTDEPFLVSARIGVALVAADGEVVVRYRDTYETLLSGARGPDTAGRDLAHELAAEVAKVWAVDPRLWEAEPRSVPAPPPREGHPERLEPVEVSLASRGGPARTALGDP